MIIGTLEEFNNEKRKDFAKMQILNQQNELKMAEKGSKILVG